MGGSTVGLSADGRLLVKDGKDGDGIELYDVATGTLRATILRVLKRAENTIEKFVFSPLGHGSGDRDDLRRSGKRHRGSRGVSRRMSTYPAASAASTPASRVTAGGFTRNFTRPRTLCPRRCGTLRRFPSRRVCAPNAPENAYKLWSRSVCRRPMALLRPPPRIVCS
jgi:site-specific DNA-cytosine methylase